MDTAQLPTRKPAPAPHELPGPRPGQPALPGPVPFPPEDAGADHKDKEGQEGHGEHGQHEEVIPKDLPKVPTWVAVVVGVVAMCLLIALFLIGWFPHHRQKLKLEADAKEARTALPIVVVTQPRRMDTTVEVLLPGDVRAMQETAMYPRANGYLAHWYVDINDHVTKGQLLAEISTPEVDAQLQQARAAVQQAQANVTRAQYDNDLAQSTYVRYQGLVATGGVTQQELDEKHSAADTAKSALVAANANVGAAQADVQRLEALQSYEKVIAPFSGTITARNYDNGALLSPTDLTPGHELFHLADTDTLRVFVNVPQAYVTLIQTGNPAYLLVRNYAGREFIGTVTRSTGALDPATRTLRMEVDIPNIKHELWAGMYGQIKFRLTQPEPPLIIPTSAMLFLPEGTEVATVQPEEGGKGKVHFKKIDIGRDYGTELEIASGLSGEEQIVANPGEHLSEGAEVQISGATPVGDNSKDVQAAENQ